MRRRELLATAAALSTGGLAGCIAGSGGDGPTGDETTATTTTEPADDETASGGETTGEGVTPGTPSGGDGSDGSDGSTDDGTPAESGGTPTGDGSATEQSFAVTDAGCAEGAGDEATAGFADDRVRIAGTIPGNNGCYRARLADATYDDGADEFVVTVEAFVEEAETTACTQCLVAIDYEASFRFGGVLPGTVVVRHREGDDVRTVTRTSR